MHIKEQNIRAWVEGDSDSDVSIRAGRIAWPAAHCVYSKDLEPARRSTTAAEHRIDGQEEERENTTNGDNAIMTWAVAGWYHRLRTWEATCDMLVALAYRRG